MAVVRLESAGHGLPAVSDAVREVVPAAELPGIRALQIDFDARKSERAWYGRFLRELRQAVPQALPAHDHSAGKLVRWRPLDARTAGGGRSSDAVPHGTGGANSARSFAESACRASVGVSTDEFPARIPRGRRLYFFHPGPWTVKRRIEAAVAQASGPVVAMNGPSGSWGDPRRPGGLPYSLALFVVLRAPRRARTRATDGGIGGQRQPDSSSRAPAFLTVVRLESAGHGLPAVSDAVGEVVPAAVLPVAVDLVPMLFRMGPGERIPAEFSR